VLSAAVFSYQLTIVISLIAARFIGAAFNKPDTLFWVALGWTVFTFVFVFVSPLLILQLLVIWGVTAWIRPKDEKPGHRPNKLETLTDGLDNLSERITTSGQRFSERSDQFLENWQKRLDESIQDANKRAEEQNRRIQEKLDSDPKLRKKYEELVSEWEESRWSKE